MGVVALFAALIITRKIECGSKEYVHRKARKFICRIAEMNLLTKTQNGALLLVCSNAKNLILHLPGLLAILCVVYRDGNWGHHWWPWSPMETFWAKMVSKWSPFMAKVTKAPKFLLFYRGNSPKWNIFQHKISILQIYMLFCNLVLICSYVY